MSYEGYVEYLTEQGFRLVYDAFDEPSIQEINATLENGDRVKFRHAVDQTNGTDAERVILEGQFYDEENSSDLVEKTMKYHNEAGPKIPIGYNDVWKEDHHGNKYAIKKLKYKPAHSCWKAVEYPLPVERVDYDFSEG